MSKYLRNGMSNYKCLKLDKHLSQWALITYIKVTCEDDKDMGLNGISLSVINRPFFKYFFLCFVYH